MGPLGSFATQAGVNWTTTGAFDRKTEHLNQSL